MKTILFDRDVLLNLYGDCQESKAEIFSDFLTDFTETKQNLISTFETGNLISFKRVLHYHGPSFMYLGLPEVAAAFKSLEKKCEETENHFSLSDEFLALMRMVDECRIIVNNEMENLKKAV